MIDYEKELEIINKNHEDSIKCLEFAKDFEKVSFIKESSLYFTEIKDFKEMNKELKGYKYILETYFAAIDKLCIYYKIGDFGLYFYIPLTQENLDKVSKGKCKIIETTKRNKEIICEMEEF